MCQRFCSFHGKGFANIGSAASVLNYSQVPPCSHQFGRQVRFDTVKAMDFSSVLDRQQDPETPLFKENTSSIDFRLQHYQKFLRTTVMHLSKLNKLLEAITAGTMSDRSDTKRECVV